MASLRQRGQNWYARVSLWDGDRQGEKEIPLCTTSKVEALERRAIVNKYEKDIKSGLSFTFAWQNEDGQVNIKRFTLDEAIKEYIVKRRINGIRSKTIEIYQLALNHLINVVGKSVPLKSITNEHIDRFIEYYRNKRKKHSVTTININLRAIKTFFQWYKKRGLLDKIPLIEQLLSEEEEPLYITDRQFEQIVKLEWLPNRYKNAFVFYRETGCRLREPFFSKMNNGWMEIPKEYSKNRKARHIQLNDRLILILNEMKAHYLENPTEDRIKYYSKQFQKALHNLQIQGRKFHSLRHTYCVRRIIQTNGNIFLVRDEMGHRSVTTTERYAKLDRKRLLNDFPSLLLNNTKNEAKTPIMDTVSMDISTHTIGFIEGGIS